MYIQGGGFALNSNSNYNGSGVVEQSGNGIVFVNFNYRVGALGFLASEAVRRDGHLNAGLLDQRLLLHWVRKNIAKVTHGRRRELLMSIHFILTRGSLAVTLIMS